VELLAEKSVSLDGKSVNLAAEFGFLEILKFLLEEEAPLESKHMHIEFRYNTIKNKIYLSKFDPKQYRSNVLF
jgi:hypothetical protein